MDIINYIMGIIDSFFKNEVLPETMQGIGIAIITIFVSIVTILYPKIESGNAEDVVKQHLLFHKVIGFKNILIGLGLVYLPFLLWTIESSLLKKAVLFVLSFLGIIILCAPLYRSGKWLLAKDQQDTGIEENYINKLIEEYLTSESNNADDDKRKNNLFFMIWSKKYSDNQIYIEKKYFDYFLFI